MQIEDESNDTSPIRTGINYISHLGGNIANPVMLAAGAGIGKGIELAGEGTFGLLSESAQQAISKPLKDYLPEKISSYVPEMLGKGDEAANLSFASLMDRTAKGIGIGGAFSAMQGIDDNYNQATNSISGIGVVKSATEGGAMGLAFEAVPVAFGILRSNIARSIEPGVTPESVDSVISSNPDAAETALKSGAITQNEFDAYKILNDPKAASIRTNRKRKRPKAKRRYKAIKCKSDGT
jgi:hypothetical protein